MAVCFKLPPEISQYPVNFIVPNENGLTVKGASVTYYYNNYTINSEENVVNYMKLVNEKNKILLQNKLYVYVIDGTHKGNVGLVESMNWEYVLPACKITKQNRSTYFRDVDASRKVSIRANGNLTDDDFKEYLKDFQVYGETYALYSYPSLTMKGFKVRLKDREKPITISPENLVILEGYDGGIRDFNVGEEAFAIDMLGSGVNIGDLVLAPYNSYGGISMVFGKIVSRTNKTFTVKPISYKGQSVKSEFRVSFKGTDFLKVDDNIKKNLTKAIMFNK